MSKRILYTTVIFIIILVIGVVSGIAISNSNSNSSTEMSNKEIVLEDTHSHQHGEAHSHNDIDDHTHDELLLSTLNVEQTKFFEGALSDQITEVACTLSNGDNTTCLSITIAGYPSNYETGPFCPRTINDTAESVGIWFDGDNIYDLTGEFIQDLPNIYNDEAWKLYDEDGNIKYTDTQDLFNNVAQPDVDEEFQMSCVEGRVEWLTNGEPIERNFVIPKDPVKLDSSAQIQSQIGVSLNGVVIDRSAPVNAILSAYTIAAFDDCGGHYNPTAGYHLHGITGCFELDLGVEGETPLIGYALDGFPILAETEDTSDLDECGGHSTDGIGYHYHANPVVENQVLSCMYGAVSDQYASNQGGPGGPGGAGGPRPPR